MGRAPEPLCNGGCGATVYDASGTMSFCGVCYYVETTLKREGCDTLAALEELDRPPRVSRERVLWRVTDLLRRAQPDDADELAADLERLTRPAV